MAIATGGIKGAGGLGLTNRLEQQMILKRVVSVILDDSHQYYTGAQSLGTIFYDDPYSNIYKSGLTPTHYNPKNQARPITPNTQFYPLIGELVFLVTTMSNKPAKGTDKTFEPRNYYFPPIRVHNQSSQNSQPSGFENENINLTEKRDRAQSGTPNKSGDPSEPIFKLGEFFEDRGIKRLLPYEGDYIIEGRFGNSIRFGSTTPYDNETERPYPNPWSFNSINGKSTPDETEAQVGDPITIIRNGQSEEVEGMAVLEDINGDHSSIYLCSNQRLETLEVAGASERSPKNIRLEAYLQSKEDERNQIAQDNAATAELYTAIGLVVGGVVGSIIPGAGTTLVAAGGGAGGYLIAELTADEIPGAPVITITGESSGSQDDDTDDGLSFYNEMVGSGAVSEGNFIEEIVEYENVSVSGTELDPDGEAENQAAGATAGGAAGSVGAEAVQDKPTDYPVRIFCRKNSGYFADIPVPIPSNTVAKNIKSQQGDKYKKSSRVEYLVIHTSAGLYGETHLDVAYLFMQQKPWTRVGYATTIDKAGMCCRIHEDGYFTNGVNSKGFGSNVRNANSVNISWLGGASTSNLSDGGDAMTKQQATALKQIIKAYCDVYPNIKVLGHNQVKTKACPRFYVPDYMRLLGGKYAKNAFEFDGQNPGAKDAILISNAKKVFEITELQSGA